jgi:hypothetical protein
VVGAAPRRSLQLRGRREPVVAAVLTA